jgi:eukaryotic-like serine/threonine-protein kinase
VSWSPDSKYVTSSCAESGYAYVWEAASGKRIFAYAGHQGSMNFVAWSPDGTRIASGGDDQTVQVWDAMTGAHMIRFTVDIPACCS